MNDVYVECLTEGKGSKKVSFVKNACFVLSIFFIFAAFFMNELWIFQPIFILLAIVFGVLSYVANMFLDIEYEYLYVDKSISIDRIYNKSRRKKMDEFSVERIEIFAPIKSYHLDNYRNRQVTEKDYSIGEELQPDERYVMYYEGGVKVILSPSEEMVKALKMVAPRKVFTE